MGLKEKFQNLSKKKIFAIIALIALLIGLGVAGYYETYHVKKVKEQHEQKMREATPEGKIPSDYEVGKDYNNAIKADKPVFVLFYADWCRYCVRFMPIFEEAANKYGEDIEFAKVNVEDKKYEKFVKDTKLSGFPTVIIFDKKYDNKIYISNSNLTTIEDLSKELDRFTRIRKLLDSKE